MRGVSPNRVVNVIPMQEEEWENLPLHIRQQIIILGYKFLKLQNGN